MQTIQIGTNGGENAAVDAHVMGYFGIHRSHKGNRKGWVVTHIPTGQRVASGVPRINRARWLCEKLERVDGCKWDSTNPAAVLGTGYQEAYRLRELAQSAHDSELDGLK